VGAALLAGCGDSTDDPGERSSSESPLVATTTIWADITSNVACGEHVESIVPNGGDPHAFELSLRDRELLERAAVVVANGGGLEGSLVDVLATAADERVVDITPHVELIDDNPHVWQDPLRVAAAIDTIEHAVIEAGRDEAAISACAAAYREQLASLDREITATLAPIPTERRVLVTNHDAFGYFADRYDFEIVAVVIPGGSTLLQPSSAHLAGVIEAMQEAGTSVIFAGTTEPAAVAEAITADLGGEAGVVALHTESLGDPGSEAGTLPGMLITNAERIAEALA
jgi:zinc/manganese transport system substrate-binding protein